MEPIQQYIKPLFTIRLETDEMHAGILGEDENNNLYYGRVVAEAGGTLTWFPLEQWEDR